MIDWILDNKEWLFSGVGITVLGIIVLFFKKMASSKQKIVEEKNVEALTLKDEEEIEPLESESQKRLSYVTPKDIFETLDHIPDLQKEDIIKNYIGLLVEWDTILSSASKRKSFENEDVEKVRLQLTYEDERKLMLVYCTVDLNHYKELIAVKKKTPIRIKGVISSIDPPAIEIENATIKIFPNNKTTSN